MRAIILLGAMIFSVPAFADGDADFKKQVETISGAYIDAFNKKDADVVIANYAPDGIFLAPDGHTERGSGLRKDLDSNFSHGLQISDITVLEAHRFSNAGYAIGKLIFLNPSRNLKVDANWNATYVIDGDKVLIKLLALSLPPPPPK